MTVRDGPVRHPDDREPTDHEGPWLAVLGAVAVGWTLLFVLDRTLLTGGTLLWATVRSLRSLVLAPVAAAALYQDTRALDGRGVDVGWLRFGYALAALLVPPTALGYLLYRYTRT